MTSPLRLSNPTETLSYQKLKDQELLDADYVRQLDKIRFQAGIIGGGHDSLVTGGDIVGLKGIGPKTAAILKSREFGIQTIGALAKSDANFDRGIINDLTSQQRQAVNALRDALKTCFVASPPV